MFVWISSPEAWISLATLTALEIVLGIDNIIFISILVGRLPAHQRNFARTTGLALAMVSRLALLFSIAWVVTLVDPWFTVLGQEISGRDVILIGGGLFLLAKWRLAFFVWLQRALTCASSFLIIIHKISWIDKRPITRVYKARGK